MASIQLVRTSTLAQEIAGNTPYTFDLGFDLIFDPVAGTDEDLALARAVAVALNTDRQALADDVLPNDQDDDRRGWWGDLDAATVWNGWPIGTRLWLMERDKLTDAKSKQGSAVARATTYINEALQPFVDAKICSKFTVDLGQVGNDQISGIITIYRGPKTAIALQYQSVWNTFSS